MNDALKTIFDLTKIKNIETIADESGLKVRDELFKREENPIKNFPYTFTSFEFEDGNVYLMSSKFWTLLIATIDNKLYIYDHHRLVYSTENTGGKKVKIDTWDDTHCYVYSYTGNEITQVILIEKTEDNLKFSELKCEEGITVHNYKGAYKGNESSPDITDVQFITKNNKLYAYNLNFLAKGFDDYQLGYAHRWDEAFFYVSLYDNNGLVAVSIRGVLYNAQYLYKGFQLDNSYSRKKALIYQLKSSVEDSYDGYAFVGKIKDKEQIVCIYLNVTIEYFGLSKGEEFYVFRINNCQYFPMIDGSKPSFYFLRDANFMPSYNLYSYYRGIFEIPEVESIEDVLCKQGISTGSYDTIKFKLYKPEEYNSLD
ncbi:MAG: hypothetical protein IKF38_06160 [Clostridia bacterium]|nr:hypothetical protein [Clostridia bacterium]